MFFLFLMAGSIQGQNQNARVQKITTSQGLSHNYVSSIIKDVYGFMWFGTWDGLNRFDGSNVLQFLPDTAAGSLSDGVILELGQDNKGDLWVLNLEGLNKYAYQQDRFHLVYQDQESLDAGLRGGISSLAVGADNEIWVGSVHGVVSRLIMDEAMQFVDSLVHYDLRPVMGRSGVSNTNINDLFEDSHGQLWIANNSGLFKLDKSDATLVPVGQGYFPAELPASLVHTIYEDHRGRIWVGHEIGITVFDYRGKVLRSYRTDDNSGLGHAVVRSIGQDRKGRMIAGTLGGVFVLAGDRFHRLPTGNEPFSINNEFISVVWVDEKDNVWVGTEKGGVNRFNQSFQPFSHIDRRPGSGYRSLNNEVVNSVVETQAFLWVGTAGGGLNVIDKQSGKTHYLMQGDRPHKDLSHNFISGLVADGKGGVWAATWGGGLNHVRPSGHSSFTIERYNSANGGLSNYFISSLYRDRHDNLWLGGSLGVEVFDAKAGRFHLLSCKFNGETIGGVSSLLIDSKERLWVGTVNGLYMYELVSDAEPLARIQPETIYFYGHRSEDPSGMSGSHIVSMLEDRTGQLWFSVFGSGLDRLDSLSADKHKAVFSNFSVRNGLAHNIVYGILEDDEKGLWLSTDRGLTHFNYQEGRFRVFTEAEGLISDQFYWSAYHRNPDGVMYFGTTSGLLYFNPVEVEEPVLDAPLVLTDLKVFNQALKVQEDGALSTNIVGAERVELKYHQNMVGIEFAALNYTNPDKIRYRYWLEGVDRGWVESSSRSRVVNYTNLSPGNYVFRVEASGDRGASWSVRSQPFQLVVLPPWWQQLWFRLLLGILLLLSLIMILRAYVRRVLHRAHITILDERHQLRTLIDSMSDAVFIKDNDSRYLILNQGMLQLLGVSSEKDLVGKTDYDFYAPALAGQLWEQERRLLRERLPVVDDEVLVPQGEEMRRMAVTKSPLINSRGQLIGLVGFMRDVTLQRQAEEALSVQREQLRAANEELKLLNATKDRFFSIVAHDLRNPFNALIGFSELLVSRLSKLSQQKVASYAELIYSSALRGYELLENLLQWSRSQTGHLNFAPVQLSLYVTVQEVFSSLTGEAERKSISLEADVPLSMQAYADAQMLQSILRNLLSNAIKYSSSGDKVLLSAASLSDGVAISVADHGVGIPKSLLPSLFLMEGKISTPGTASEAGSGLGLLLIKEFVERHGGVVSVESEEGKGTTFRFTLPNPG